MGVLLLAPLNFRYSMGQIRPKEDRAEIIETYRDSLGNELKDGDNVVLTRSLDVTILNY